MPIPYSRMDLARTMNAIRQFRRRNHSNLSNITSLLGKRLLFILIIFVFSLSRAKAQATIYWPARHSTYEANFNGREKILKGTYDTVILKYLTGIDSAKLDGYYISDLHELTQTLSKNKSPIINDDLEISNSYLGDFRSDRFRTDTAKIVFRKKVVFKDCFFENLELKNMIFEDTCIFWNCVSPSQIDFFNLRFLSDVTIYFKWFDTKSLYLNNCHFDGRSWFSLDTGYTFSETNTYHKGQATYSFFTRNLDTVKNVSFFKKTTFEDYLAFGGKYNPIIQNFLFKDVYLEKGIKGAPYFVYNKSLIDSVDYELYNFSKADFPKDFTWQLIDAYYVSGDTTERFEDFFYRDFDITFNKPSIYQILNTEYSFLYPSGVEQLIFVHQGHEMTYQNYLSIQRQYDRLKEYVRNMSGVDQSLKDKAIDWILYQEQVLLVYYLTDNMSVSNFFQLIGLGFLYVTVNFGYNGEWNFIGCCLIVIFLFAWKYYRRYKKEVHYSITEAKEDNYYFTRSFEFFKCLWFSTMIFISIKIDKKYFHFNNAFLKIVLFEWFLGLLLFIIFFVYVASRYPFVKDLVGI